MNDWEQFKLNQRTKWAEEVYVLKYDFEKARRVLIDDYAPLVLQHLRGLPDWNPKPIAEIFFDLIFRISPPTLGVNQIIEWALMLENFGPEFDYYKPEENYFSFVDEYNGTKKFPNLKEAIEYSNKINGESNGPATKVGILTEYKKEIYLDQFEKKFFMKTGKLSRVRGEDFWSGFRHGMI